MNLKLTKYLVFLYIFFIFFIFNIETQANSLFLVEDIEITFNTDKTGEIRNKAIGLAESNGLTRLAKRILTTEDFKKFQKKNDIDINYIVESIEFSNEILSDNYYKASINIKFNPYRTREFFRENNFNFSEIQSNPIPFYAVLANHEQYFIVNNEWEKRWKELILTNDTLNLEFIDLSRDKKNGLNLSNFLSLDFIIEDDILDHNNIILIWCEPRMIGSEIELNIITKIIIDNKAKILNNNFLESFYINEASYISNIVNQINNEVYDYWINSTLQSDILNKFKFRHSSGNLNSWVKIENILQTIDSIPYYEIQELTSKDVKGEINFYGNSEKFRLILGEYNIITTDIGSVQVLQLDHAEQNS